MTVKEKMIRLSKVKKDLEFHLKKKIGYPELEKYINENYPYIKISSKPQLSSVPQRIAIEMIKELAHPTESARDAKEHLYMLMPDKGVYLVPQDPKDKAKKGILELGVTVYGTVDLVEYAKRLRGNSTIHDLAEYLKLCFGAKEITYEEFRDRAVKGKKPKAAYTPPNVDFGEFSEWESGDLEALAGTETVDTTTIKGLPKGG